MQNTVGNNQTNSKKMDLNHRDNFISTRSLTDTYHQSVQERLPLSNNYFQSVQGIIETFWLSAQKASLLMTQHITIAQQKSLLARTLESRISVLWGSIAVHVRSRNIRQAAIDAEMPGKIMDPVDAQILKASSDSFLIRCQAGASFAVMMKCLEQLGLLKQDVVEKVATVHQQVGRRRNLNDNLDSEAHAVISEIFESITNELITTNNAVLEAGTLTSKMDGHVMRLKQLLRAIVLIARELGIFVSPY